MNPDEELIEQLYDDLSEYYHCPDPEKARQVAEQLATILGEPTAECVHRHLHPWILIWDARGEHEKAIGLQALDIARKLSEIESGDYDSYPELFLRQMEYVHDSCYLQALRYQKINRIEAALRCLQQSFDLSERYSHEFDSDNIAFYNELNDEEQPGS